MTRIVAISVGRVETLVKSPGHEVLSAIAKHPVSTLQDPKPVEVHRLGVVGDTQADHRVHGGVLKAVYAYPSEHYAFWQELMLKETDLRSDYPYGQFGENLTIEGFIESEVFVGDRWRLGELELEVVKNREPCFKFNLQMHHRQAAQWMLASGTCGWYLSVHHPGKIQAGQAIEVRPGPRELSIRAMNDALSAKQGTLF